MNTVYSSLNIVLIFKTLILVFPQHHESSQNQNEVDRNVYCDD